MNLAAATFEVPRKEPGKTARLVQPELDGKLPADIQYRLKKYKNFRLISIVSVLVLIQKPIKNLFAKSKSLTNNLAYVNTALGLVLGAMILALSPRFTGLREPWDGAFAYYFECLFLSGLISALPCPRHWWTGTIGVYAGQFAFMFIAYGFGNLWPLGMIIGAVFMVISLLGGGVVFGTWFLLTGRKHRRTE